MFLRGRFGSVVVAGCAVAFLTACSSDSDAPAPGSADATNVSTRAASATAVVKAGASEAPVGSATQPPETVGGSDEPAGGGGQVSAAERTLAAGIGGNLAGGDPAAQRTLVAPLPTTPPGTQPDVDPTSVPQASPPDATYQLLIDLDPTVAGVQTERMVDVGDRIRAVVVLANVPPSLGGVAAFNFNLAYDRGVVVAPTYGGGSATERNPDLVPAAETWLCIPAPEGDLDDPGGLDGDRDPTRGEAFLSCFAADAALQGTQVLATIEFVAVASGSTDLQLEQVAVGNSYAIAIGRCTGDGGDGQEIPCPASTLTVR